MIVLLPVFQATTLFSAYVFLSASFAVLGLTLKDKTHSSCPASLIKLIFLSVYSFNSKTILLQQVLDALIHYWEQSHAKYDPE